MKVVTTVHDAGFRAYGHRWIDSVSNWPAGTDFVMYAEGFQPMNVPYVDCAALWRLNAFKERHAAYRPPSWRFDIVRFAHKVFAAHHALYEHEGIGVWLDADCVTYQSIPEGYIEAQLGDAYFAHFRRTAHYTETGMWIVNCAHPEHRAFMDTWLNWFETDAFKRLPEWHDCTTLDATLRLFERDGRITTKSLSGEFERDMHPMAKADIGRYVDHCKGARKELGRSPENLHRAEAAA